MPSTKWNGNCWDDWNIPGNWTNGVPANGYSVDLTSHGSPSGPVMIHPGYSIANSLTLSGGTVDIGDGSTPCSVTLNNWTASGVSVYIRTGSTATFTGTTTFVNSGPGYDVFGILCANTGTIITSNPGGTYNPATGYPGTPSLIQLPDARLPSLASTTVAPFLIITRDAAGAPVASWLDISCYINGVYSGTPVITWTAISAGFYSIGITGGPWQAGDRVDILIERDRNDSDQGMAKWYRTIVQEPANVFSISGTAQSAGVDVPAGITSIKNTLALLSTEPITFSSPVTQNGATLTLVKSDDYNATTGQPIQFGATGWPVLTAPNLTLNIRTAKTLNTIVTQTATSVTTVGQVQTINFNLTSAQTGKLVPDSTGLQTFEVVAMFGGYRRTLIMGTCVVIGTIRW